jgi:hypothetical protein
MTKSKIGMIVAVIGFVSASSAVASPYHHHPGRNPGHSDPTPPSPGAATPVPEPADGILLLMGVAGVAVGRRFQARRESAARLRTAGS